MLLCFVVVKFVVVDFSIAVAAKYAVDLDLINVVAVKYVVGVFIIIVVPVKSAVDVEIIIVIVLHERSERESEASSLSE